MKNKILILFLIQIHAVSLQTMHAAMLDIPQPTFEEYQKNLNPEYFQAWIIQNKLLTNHKDEQTIKDAYLQYVFDKNPETLISYLPGFSKSKVGTTLAFTDNFLKLLKIKHKIQRHLNQSNSQDKSLFNQTLQYILNEFVKNDNLSILQEFLLKSPTSISNRLTKFLSKEEIGTILGLNNLLIEQKKAYDELEKNLEKEYAILTESEKLNKEYIKSTRAAKSYNESAQWGSAHKKRMLEELERSRMQDHQQFLAISKKNLNPTYFQAWINNSLVSKNPNELMIKNAFLDYAHDKNPTTLLELFKDPLKKSFMDLVFNPNMIHILNIQNKFGLLKNNLKSIQQKLPHHDFAMLGQMINLYIVNPDDPQVQQILNNRPRILPTLQHLEILSPDEFKILTNT